MDDLIRDLEAATEGSRALDHRVRWAVGFSDVGGPLDYTTSIDAALTLVKSCRMVELRFETPDDGCDTAASAEITFTAEDPRHYGMSATPALALCIAVLKARDHATDRAPAP